MGDVITYFAGERPATYEEDFVVRRGIFTKNIIEVAGIQSPGITTAPAVAKDVERWAIMFLGKQEKVKVNENYNPKHKSVPHLADMSEEDRNELIKKTPLTARSSAVARKSRRAKFWTPSEARCLYIRLTR